MIKENVRQILSELPPGVELLAAAKSRTPAEIIEAAEAGVKMIGENYVQEAEQAFLSVGHRARWHFIGHLQKNKVKKAVRIFDVIETVDSLALAEEINKRCVEANKVMEILVEINSGRESQKSGVWPEQTESLIKELVKFDHIKVMGLMTMGSFSEKAEDSRIYFSQTRKIFEQLKAANLPQAQMRYLSMGMTASYKVAIEEGANIVRIGTGIFGERLSKSA
jgi:PLP dependent protein